MRLHAACGPENIHLAHGDSAWPPAVDCGQMITDIPSRISSSLSNHQARRILRGRHLIQPKLGDARRHCAESMCMLCPCGSRGSRGQPAHLPPGTKRAPTLVTSQDYPATSDTVVHVRCRRHALAYSVHPETPRFARLPHHLLPSVAVHNNGRQRALQ